MHGIINKIVQQNQSLFGTNLKIYKINIGFTNTIYNINDLYIVKICNDEDNEKEFIKVINGKEYRCYSIFYHVGNGGFNIDKSIEDILWIKDEVLKEN